MIVFVMIIMVIMLSWIYILHDDFSKHSTTKAIPKSDTTVKTLEEELGLFQLDDEDYYELVENLIVEMGWTPDNSIKFVAEHQKVGSDMVFVAHHKGVQIRTQKRAKIAERVAMTEPHNFHLSHLSKGCELCDRKYKECRSSPRGRQWLKDKEKEADIESQIALTDAKVAAQYNLIMSKTNLMSKTKFGGSYPVVPHPRARRSRYRDTRY